MRLSKAMPDVPIVIKLHRKDRLDTIKRGSRIVPRPGSRVVSHDAHGFPADIYDWLQGCSLFLTGASTVALEAMVMDVPVVTMDFCNEIHDVDFIDAGATVHVANGEMLEQVVRETLATAVTARTCERRVKSFIEKSFYALTDIPPCAAPMR